MDGTGSSPVVIAKRTPVKTDATGREAAPDTTYGLAGGFKAAPAKDFRGTMRDRSKTIASLRRLIERPGTPQEGETARRLLEMMGGKDWVPRPFDVSMFPCGTVVYYCYWCYDNDRGTVRTKPPQMHHGQWWMLIKFDRLKSARWVPVTSDLGCHLGFTPFEGNDFEVLNRMDVDWEETYRKMLEKFRALGIDVSRLERKEDVEVIGVLQ